jgi:hypothetical protein
MLFTVSQVAVNFIPLEWKGRNSLLKTISCEKRRIKNSLSKLIWFLFNGLYDTINIFYGMYSGLGRLT